MSYAGDLGDDSGFFQAQQGQLTPDSISRQLALAKALQDQAQTVRPGAYGGLGSAINSIGSAILSHRAEQAQADRYAQVMKSMFGGGQQQPQAPPPPSQASQVASGQLDPEGNPLAATMPAPPPAPPPQQAAGGPLGSALGPSRAALYAALMQAEGPGAGMQLLPKMVEEAANRQQAQQLLAQLTGQGGPPSAPGQPVSAQTPPIIPTGAGQPASGLPTSPQAQPAPGMPDWQRRGLAMSAMSGDPNAVIKQAMTYNQPFDLDGVKYAWGANGQATPIVNPKQTIDIPRSQFKALGIDPNSVPSTTQIEYNPITKQFVKNELGDIKSPVAQQQAIQAAAARAQAMYGLQPEQQAAINQAVAAGTLDPSTLTRGNAQIVAGTLRANPDTDIMNLHAYRQQIDNPQLQRLAQQTMRIPQMLQTVADSGKALGYSDAQFLGKLQQWKNGQLNDPAFTRYMTQRNDALLSMSGAMRGNGATDLATQLEEEAAKPTMSPAAIDAWHQAHLDVLGPMVNYYKNYAITNPHTNTPVNTNPNTPFSQAPAAQTKTTTFHYDAQGNRIQ